MKHRCAQGASSFANGAMAGSETLQNRSLDGPKMELLYRTMFYWVELN